GECGREGMLGAYSPRAGGAVCAACRGEDAIPLSQRSLRGIDGLLRRPLADAEDAALDARSARETLRVVVASHEYHGGFRLRTLAGGTTRRPPPAPPSASQARPAPRRPPPCRPPTT